MSKVFVKGPLAHAVLEDGSKVSLIAELGMEIRVEFPPGLFMKVDYERREVEGKELHIAKLGTPMKIESFEYAAPTAAEISEALLSAPDVQAD